MDDPELLRLLLEEIVRHQPALEDDAPEPARQAALNSLKGSAAVAGARELSAGLGRIERRIAEGDTTALGAARELVVKARRALESGEAPPEAPWPAPPEDLVARPIEAWIHERYASEMQDRLARLDAGLARADHAEAAGAAFREVHAMKGAALAAGDEVTAWFCHGVEDRLRKGERSAADARRAVEETARWRGVLGEMIVDPGRALETLRVLTRPSGSGPTSIPTPALARRAVEHDEHRGPDGSVRVATATLDRLFERVRQLAQARIRVNEGSRGVHGVGAAVRRLRGQLRDSLRLIGPPRPWGAPAAALASLESAAGELAALADRLDREAWMLSQTADRVREEAALAHADLAATRTTGIGGLFDRVAAAVTAQARREGREVKLISSGGDTPIDRRAAEALFDPLLQLARNAVAHGIEPVEERLARGKPRVGTVRLAASAIGGGLRIEVEDDGAGVDVALLRSRARQAGTLSDAMAQAIDDETLLTLLFVPGLSMREGADLLAGRGVGLDLALEAVRRLGGTIRLASRPGSGVTATLDVPLERGHVKVMWVDAEGTTYALPIRETRRVLPELPEGSARMYSLASCVRGRPRLATMDSVAVELEPVVDGLAPPRVGVDAVFGVEEVVLRAVSPLVTAAGPYMGAIVRGDELRLCVDAQAIAEIVASGCG